MFASYNTGVAQHRAFVALEIEIIYSKINDDFVYRVAGDMAVHDVHDVSYVHANWIVNVLIFAFLVSLNQNQT
jgi:hypothetical protein